MSEMGQVRLPAELLLAIFSLLPAVHILKCKQLSRHVRDLLCASAEIQYQIELYSAYQREMETNAGNYNMPVSDRLQVLRGVSNGWAALRFSHRSVLGYPLMASFVYEVSGGRLVLGSDLKHTASNLNGTSVLSVHDLPTRPGNDPATKSSHADTIHRRDIQLPTPIADFAMDVHQNLLVLVQRTMDHNIQLLLRTFDANIPHPDANCPVLDMPNQSWVTIHISGPILACLFVDFLATGKDSVVVWNWKTGHRLGNFTGVKQKSFVLISSSSLAVANMDAKTLDVYDIDESTETLALSQRLELPPAHWEVNGRSWTYDEALLRSHPTPLPERQSSATSSMLRPHTELPFTTNEEDGIVSCTFYCYAIGSSFTLILHRSALRRKYVVNRERNWMPGSLPQLPELWVPWNEWGPDNTRWINSEPSQRWICYVHGHRLAVLEAKSEQFDGRSSAVMYDSDDDDEPTHARRLALIQQHLEHIKLGGSSSDYSHMASADQVLFTSDEDSGYHYLRVFDFNPRGVRRALAEGKLPVGKPNATCKMRVTQGQTVVEESSLLAETIVTNLPYLETTVRLRDIGLEGKRKLIEGVMMNAESIMIMLSHSSWSDGVEVLTV